MGKKKNDTVTEGRGDAETVAVETAIPVDETKQAVDAQDEAVDAQDEGVNANEATIADSAVTNEVENQATGSGLKGETPPPIDSEQEKKFLQALAIGEENQNAVRLLHSFLVEHFDATDLTTPFQVVDFAMGLLIAFMRPPSTEKALEVLRPLSNDELAAMQVEGDTLLLNVNRLVSGLMAVHDNLHILDGRVLYPGTELKLGTDTVTLASKALITFPMQGRESFFAGMLATSHPEHLRINAQSLKWKYNHDARLLPIEQQGLTPEEIDALSNEDRELFGLPKKS